MSGIQGVGGVSGPDPDRPAAKPDAKPAKGQEYTSSEDGVAISSEAQAAARIAALINAADDQPDIRADKVRAAKEAIERGDYKNPDVVSEIANRINKIL